MDPFALARTLQRLMPVMDRACRPAEFAQHRFDRAPCGTAYVGVAPAEQHEHASANQNRINLYGTEGGLTAQGLAQMIGLFAAAKVAQFNVWVSPGPEMESVRRWVAEAGLTRAPWVRYLTLARDAAPAVPADTDLVVREVGAREVAALGDALDGAAWPDFRRSVGAAGFHHFIAFDGDRPAGSAGLFASDGLGYLGMALTAEPFRRRGAQSALIAARIEAARALGCTTLVSETLDILKSSLGNLRKAGFDLVYEREVYRPGQAEIPGR